MDWFESKKSKNKNKIRKIEKKNAKNFFQRRFSTKLKFESAHSINSIEQFKDKILYSHSANVCLSSLLFFLFRFLNFCFFLLSRSPFMICKTKQLFNSLNSATRSTGQHSDKMAKFLRRQAQIQRSSERERKQKLNEALF